MPYTLDFSSEQSQTAIGTQKYEYDYPDGLDLDPRSDLHQKLVSKILRRANESKTKMTSRYDSWNEIDKTLMAYIPIDEAEAEVKAADSRKPVSIVVPISYATMETLLSYFASAFLTDPIFQYEGSGPEDVTGAILLEKIVQHQSRKAKMELNLHTQWRDSFAYGFGAIAVDWTIERGTRETVRQEDQFDAFLNNLGSQPVRDTEEVITYEGNQFSNIDVYAYLPDPNVPIHDVQRGEYVGWGVTEPLVRMLEKEEAGNDLFNAKYLKHTTGQSVVVSNVGNKIASDRFDRFNMPKDFGRNASRPVDTIFMVVALSPKEWGLSGEENIEKWLFGLSGDAVITQAKRLNFNHNKYPISIAAPDYDGYSIAPMSRLELIGGLQTTMDFMFNSHIANVRKAVNDMIVYDPSMVNANDLSDPRPGKLIRMRRRAWGKGGVDQSVKQLMINDITRANVADGNAIHTLMQQLTGATDAVQGQMRTSGERVTATEVRGTRASALSRIQKAAQIVSAMSMRDLGLMLAANTQQFMTQETYVNIAGSWEDELAETFNIKRDGRVKITPFDILVNYDVVVKDGSTPSSEFSDAWVQLFQIISQNPQMSQQFDTTRMLRRIANVLGVKNVNDFIRDRPINASVQPMEQIQGQVDKGNLIPMQGGAGQ